MNLNELNVEYKQMEYQKERKEEILCEGKYKNFQFYILNLGTHPTAYVEIPRESFLFGKGYNQIDIEVHGGLTFADSSLIGNKNNSWFIGWDYAHCTDYMGYDIDFEFNRSAKKWTTEEIFEDVVSVIEQLITTDWDKKIRIKEAREFTENHIKNELDNLADNYMKVYDEYYETGSRDSAFLKDLETAKEIEVGGDNCRRMGHALVLWQGNNPYFFEHNEDKLKELLKEKGIENEK